MGAQISAGPYPDGVSLNYSSASALVVRMTDPWYIPERDGSETIGGYYQQDDVHPSSFKAANEEIPWTLDDYLIWERLKFPNTQQDRFGKAWGRAITRSIFDDARDFVKRCADEGWSAYYSY